MRRPAPHELLGFALVVALVATAGSLNFSGIGAIGWGGMSLFPCELCWYQRILMYPLVFVLGMALLRRDAPGAIRGGAFTGLALSVPGVLVATYHSFIQYVPSLEVGTCSVGSCTSVQYRLVGLTIPNLSLVAFALITTALALVLWTPARHASGSEPQV